MKQATQGLANLKKEQELWALQNKKSAESVAYIKKELEGFKDKQSAVARQIEITNAMITKQSTIFGADSKEVEKFKSKLLDLQIQQERLNTSVRNAPKQVWNARANAIGNAGQSMRGAGMAMTIGVTAPVLAGAGYATKMAMDAVESENLFSVAMGKMEGEARSFSNAIAKSLGLNSYVLRNNMATLNSMFKSMNFDDKSSLKMSESLTVLANDMSSFYNIKIEDAFLKLKSGLVGEIEPLRQLGVLVDETSTAQYAFSRGIAKQGEELSQAQKWLARYGLIVEQTRLAQGDMARTIDSPINQLRRLKSQFEEASITAGQAFIPTMITVAQNLLAVVAFAKNTADAFNTLDNRTKNFILSALGIAIALPPIVVGFGSLFTAVSAVIGLFTNFSTVSAVLFSPTGLIMAGVAAFTVAALAIGQYNINKQAAIQKTLAMGNSAGQEIVQIKSLTDEYFSLKSKAELANNEKQRMKDLEGQLKTVAPQLTNEINSQTTSIEIQRKAVNDLISAKERLMQAGASEATAQLTPLYSRQSFLKGQEIFLNGILNSNNQLEYLTSMPSDLANKFSYSGTADQALIKNLQEQADLDKKIQPLLEQSWSYENYKKGIVTPTPKDDPIKSILEELERLKKEMAKSNGAGRNTASTAINQQTQAYNQIAKAVDNYTSKLKQATDANQNFFGSFDRSENKYVSITSMLRNAEQNRDRLVNFRGYLAQLRNSGLDDVVVNEFQSKGLSSFSEVKALATRGQQSDLARLNNVYSSSRYEAGELAKSQNSELYSTRQDNRTLNVYLDGSVKTTRDDSDLVDKIFKVLQQHGVVYN